MYTHSFRPVPCIVIYLSFEIQLSCISYRAQILSEKIIKHVYLIVLHGLIGIVFRRNKQQGEMGI